MKPASLIQVEESQKNKNAAEETEIEFQSGLQSGWRGPYSFARDLGQLFFCVVLGQYSRCMTSRRRPAPRNGASLVDRAYELARSGAFLRVSEIADRLRREGYGDTNVRITLEGTQIRAALQSLCMEAQQR
jgi:hypothetical protein